MKERSNVDVVPEINDRTISKKQLGMFTLTGLVFANMIGAGVFTTSGFALADLGSADRVMLAWLAGGLIALCGAISYGALVRYLAESGGEYLFLSRLIHPFVGFIAGWVSLLAGFTGAIAFAALTFETYIGPMLPFSLPSGVISVAVIFIAALFHGLKFELGVSVQNAVVVLKFLLILAFIAIAGVVFISSGTAESAATVKSGFSIFAFAGSLVWISLSYSGYNAAVYIAGEAADNQRTVPRSMLYGTLLVMAIYLLLNAIFVYLTPFELIAGKEDVAAISAEYIGGKPLALLVRLIIATALLTSVFSMMMAGPRVYAKMADDGLFPSIFRFTGSVPDWAIILQAVATTLLIVSTTMKDLMSYLGLTLSLSAAVTVGCLFKLKLNKESGADIKIPGYPFVPGLFIVATITLAAIATYRQPTEIIFTLITLATGGLLYVIFKKRDTK